MNDFANAKELKNDAAPAIPDIANVDISDMPQYCHIELKDA